MVGLKFSLKSLVVPKIAGHANPMPRLELVNWFGCCAKQEASGTPNAGESTYLAL